ncbi:MAG: oligosaccharide flippase family protein, partial [Akkermansiaceae bacterium]|nr:oligosaccharide flippase family protein [Akkermansiaceae bacterium]
MSADSTSGKGAYAQVLKATSLIGGSEGIAILIGIVQTKCVAIFLGPVGVGIVGTLQSLLALATRVSGLGIQSSGVREISAAVSSGDEGQVARTTGTLRRICWLTGAVGAILVAIFAAPLSVATFGSRDFTFTIFAVSWVVLMRAIQEGQRTLIQGNRRVGDLARMKIIGAAGGAVIAIVFYGTLGLSGIVPALLSLGVFNLILTWWFSRRIAVARISMGWGETFRRSGGLVRLGIVLM